MEPISARGIPVVENIEWMGIAVKPFPEVLNLGESCLSSSDVSAPNLLVSSANPKGLSDHTRLRN